MTMEDTYRAVRDTQRNVQRAYGRVGLTFGEQLDLLNITAGIYVRNSSPSR
jgi:hypothetical protein